MAGEQRLVPIGATGAGGKHPRRTRGGMGRRGAVGTALGAILALGLLFQTLPPLYHAAPEVPGGGGPGAAQRPPPRDATHLRQMRASELKTRFEQAVVMLHAGHYQYAVAALNRVLKLSPRMPEAHVNMGFSLLGLKDYRAAREFFAGAVALNPRQANGYYGLAVAHEGLGQLPEAIGAMRTYLHFAGANAPFRSKARAAIWEWETSLVGEPEGAAAPGGATPPAGGQDG